MRNAHTLKTMLIGAGIKTMLNEVGLGFRFLGGGHDPSDHARDQGRDLKLV